tara:strand:+ start:2272 stop:2538 length:267 start_codon:yes stop_codon:yes gene_type:complete
VTQRVGAEFFPKKNQRVLLRSSCAQRYGRQRLRAGFNLFGRAFPSLISWLAGLIFRQSGDDAVERLAAVLPKTQEMLDGFITKADRQR